MTPRQECFNSAPPLQPLHNSNSSLRSSQLNYESGDESAREYDVKQGEGVEFNGKKVSGKIWLNVVFICCAQTHQRNPRQPPQVATVVTPPLTPPGKIPTPVIISTYVDKREAWNGSVVEVGGGTGRIWCWKPQWWGALDERGRYARLAKTQRGAASASHATHNP